jgi:hypothetical protein
MSKSRTSRIHEQRGTALIVLKEFAASDRRAVQGKIESEQSCEILIRLYQSARHTSEVRLRSCCWYTNRRPPTVLSIEDVFCHQTLLGPQSLCGQQGYGLTNRQTDRQTDSQFSSSLMKLKCFETPATFHFSWASNVVDMFNGCSRGPHVSYNLPVYTCFSQGVSRYQIWRGGDWWHSMGRFPICIGVSLRWTDDVEACRLV